MLKCVKVNTLVFEKKETFYLRGNSTFRQMKGYTEYASVSSCRSNQKFTETCLVFLTDVKEKTAMSMSVQSVSTYF